jgi:hypothetical protein
MPPSFTEGVSWVLTRLKSLLLTECLLLVLNYVSIYKIRIYTTIILPVVLYGCEICSMTLREKHKLRVSKNKVLWRIFGPKRNDITGG